MDHTVSEIYHHPHHYFDVTNMLYLGSANQSSSCGARSSASCYNTRNRWTFNSSYLREGRNTFTLSLPARATATEDAVLPESVYLQYDALRLEIS